MQICTILAIYSLFRNFSDSTELKFEKFIQKNWTNQKLNFSSRQESAERNF